jgi:carbamoyltransferase
MSNNIIGISCFFHDAACCLLKDGVLVAAAEEERFSRSKHDAGIPKRAFNYCLEEGGLTIDEVDCVAYYEEPTKKLARQLSMMLPSLSSEKKVQVRLDPHRPKREIREILGYEGPIEYVGHHQAHAASSFYYSGFDEAAILTVDGVGEWDTTSFGRGNGNGLEILETVEFPHSLGLLYSTITGYLGFEVNEGEYKVMGLAPYGQPRHIDLIRKLIINQPGGQYLLDLQYFDFKSFQRMYSDKMLSLFGHPPRQPRTEILDFHKDLARSLQYVLEEILMDKLKYLHELTGSENLCMAGGVALNCVANGRIKREGPFKRMFVQPAAGDSGGALGAAAIAHKRRTNEQTKSLRATRKRRATTGRSQDCRLVSRPDGVWTTRAGWTLDTGGSAWRNNAGSYQLDGQTARIVPAVCARRAGGSCCRPLRSRSCVAIHAGNLSGEVTDKAPSDHARGRIGARANR